ncbi:MAG TPA: hydrolase [Tepidisphaeraceae bacterium]|jgi:nicotinamidase-related amidase
MTQPLAKLDPSEAALVLIDLQRGVTARQLAPRSAADVVRTSAALASEFRARGGLVMLVHVSFAPNGADVPPQDVDEPFPRQALPAGWDQFVDEIAPQPGDVLITKRQWGAFYGTDLDLQLRRRRRDTIVLGGIATNFGVESTARDAWERGYRLLLVEDAMASMSADDHAFAVNRIFPRLGHVCTAQDVIARLGQ